MLKPDWNFWRNLPELALWQAVALSLDLDPDAINPSNIDNQILDADGWSGEIVLSASTLGEFSKRLRLLHGNLVPHGHFSRFIIDYEDSHLSIIRLRDFVAWMVSGPQWNNLPSELLAMNAQAATPKTKAAPADGKMPGNTPEAAHVQVAAEFTTTARPCLTPLQRRQHCKGCA